VASLSCSRMNACNLACLQMSAFGDDNTFRAGPTFCRGSAGHKLPLGIVYAVIDKSASVVAGARAAALLLTSLDCFLHAACLCTAWLCFSCGTSLQSVYGPTNTSAVHAWQLKSTCVLIAVCPNVFVACQTCLTLPLGSVMIHVVC